MMSVITNSYANVVSSFYSVKFQKSIEELLISPMPNWAILLGFILGGVCRGVLVGIIVFFVSLFFYPEFEVANPMLTISVLFLTAILFSLMGFINAVFADSFDAISVVPTFVLTPLIYLGGVFYSINILPDFWRSISMANPMLYVVNTFREGMLGISDVSISFSLSMIGLFLFIFTFLSLYLLKKLPVKALFGACAPRIPRAMKEWRPMRLRSHSQTLIRRSPRRNSSHWQTLWCLTKAHASPGRLRPT
jgi:ABC-2 type transport system permease protein